MKDIADVFLSDEQKELREVAAKFGDVELAAISAEWEATGVVDFAWLSSKLLEVGFLGMTVPTEYGGASASFLDFVIVLEEMARVSMPAAFLMQATCSGPTSHIIHFASEEVKKEILPRVTAGGAILSVAMTEPDAGSDLGGMKTRGRPTGNGTLVVHGNKMYVGGGGLADYYVAYARLSDEPGTRGVGCVVVPKGTANLEYGPQAKLIGARNIPRQEVIFNGCEIPEKYVLLPAGHFHTLIDLFNVERVHNAAMSLGMAEAAFSHSLGYAGERTQFNRPLAGFQGIQWRLADMASKLTAIRLMVYSAAYAIDTGRQIGLASSMAKYLASEVAFEIADDALQIEGAFGFQEGPVETAFRNLRTFRVAAGSSEMMLNYIGRQLTGYREPKVTGPNERNS